MVFSWGNGSPYFMEILVFSAWIKHIQNKFYFCWAKQKTSCSKDWFLGMCRHLLLNADQGFKMKAVFNLNLNQGSGHAESTISKFGNNPCEKLSKLGTF